MRNHLYVHIVVRTSACPCTELREQIRGVELSCERSMISEVTSSTQRPRSGFEAGRLNPHKVGEVGSEQFLNGFEVAFERQHCQFELAVALR